jgi:hypothetical protein
MTARLQHHCDRGPERASVGTVAWQVASALAVVGVQAPLPACRWPQVGVLATQAQWRAWRCRAQPGDGTISMGSPCACCGRGPPWLPSGHRPGCGCASCMHAWRVRGGSGRGGLQDLRSKICVGQDLAWPGARSPQHLPVASDRAAGPRRFSPADPSELTKTARRSRVPEPLAHAPQE